MAKSPVDRSRRDLRAVIGNLMSGPSRLGAAEEHEEPASYPSAGRWPSQRRCESIPLTLSDLVVEMQGAAANLGQGLHNDAAFELADLVGVMNCYYSNRIERAQYTPKDRASAGRSRG